MAERGQRRRRQFTPEFKMVRGRRADRRGTRGLRNRAPRQQAAFDRVHPGIAYQEIDRVAGKVIS
jgi:hypothetical protein